MPNCRLFHTIEKNILITVKNWWSLTYGQVYIYHGSYELTYPNKRIRMCCSSNKMIDILHNIKTSMLYNDISSAHLHLDSAKF
jgi:hypothetical protein